MRIHYYDIFDLTARCLGANTVAISTILYRVNPVYNDIRYNSKIHYNVNLTAQKPADHVSFQ